MADHRVPRVRFITNFCTHYRVTTFELLAKRFSMQFLFFSSGTERFWLSEHGIEKGGMKHTNLWGFSLFNTRITPGLIIRLLLGRYDVIIKCINGKFALPVTYFIARLRRKPFILWTGVWHTIDRPLHQLIFPLTRRIYRRSAAIVVYGSHVKEYLVSQGTEPSRIFVTPQALDNEKFNSTVDVEELRALREQHSLADRKVILFLGRLDANKGLAYLIEAFDMLDNDDTTLLLSGTGPDENHFKTLAAETKSQERIIFAGYVPNDETIKYYALAHALVLPSTHTPFFKEPWGLVINEAFNQGVPVIATDKVGAAAGGLVEDGVTGLVVPERDSDALAIALRRILNDPNLRNRLGAAAKSRISDYTQEKMVEVFAQAINFVTSVDLERGEQIQGNGKPA